jgi:hypothetical protein
MLWAVAVELLRCWDHSRGQRRARCGRRGGLLCWLTVLARWPGWCALPRAPSSLDDRAPVCGSSSTIVCQAAGRGRGQAGAARRARPGGRAAGHWCWQGQRLSVRRRGAGVAGRACRQGQVLTVLAYRPGAVARLVRPRASTSTARLCTTQQSLRRGGAWARGRAPARVRGRHLVIGRGAEAKSRARGTSRLLPVCCWSGPSSEARRGLSARAQG